MTQQRDPSILFLKNNDKIRVEPNIRTSNHHIRHKILTNINALLAKLVAHLSLNITLYGRKVKTLFHSDARTGI